MPFRDRYWWLVRLGGIAMMICCAGIIGWTLWQAPTTMSDLWGNEGARFLAQNNLLIMGVCFVFFLQGISIVCSSAQGRERYRRRLAALHGELDAIPVARITMHPENVPDVTMAPLVLHWAASNATRLILAPLKVFLCAVFLALPFFVAGAVISAVQHGAFASLQLGVFGILMPVTITLLYVIPSCMAVPVLVRDLPASFGRPFGVSASPEGIASMDERGKRRSLRWEEMRLLEVTTNSAYASRTFRLYGPSTSIEWSLFSAGATYVPDGVSAAEMETRSQSLLNLINARTGLVSRTFDGPSRELSGKMGAAAAIGCIAALVLTTIAFVAGLIFLPVTTSHLLNLALIATVVYMFVGLVGAVVMSAVRKPASSEASDSPERLPGDISVSYTLTFGSTLKNRILYALSGIIICVDLVPAVLWLIAAVSVSYNDSYPHIVGVFGYAASLVLLPVGLFGLGMTVWALFTRVTSVTADAIGLTERRGRKTTSIAWNQVERVSGEAVGGTITVYNVQGAFMTISWPAVNACFPQPHPDNDILPISSYGLANLVAVRTGKSLSISDRLGDYQDAVS